jgi:hypothetical protein
MYCSVKIDSNSNANNNQVMLESKLPIVIEFCLIVSKPRAECERPSRTAADSDDLSDTSGALGLCSVRFWSLSKTNNTLYT